MADDPTECLAKLKYKRGQLKSQLTRFTNFLDNIEQTGSHDEIEVRLEKITYVLENFNEIQAEIECLSGNISQDDEREDFERKFFKATGCAKKILSNIQIQNLSQNAITNTGNISNQNANIQLQSPVRLPSINLPDFHGAYSQWMTFYDTFNSLVHSNSQLNDVQKFWYLKSCLKGEAAQLIQSLETTNQNYLIAWGMLKERFDNKRLIVHTHIKNIFDSAILKNESHVQLRTLLDNLNKNIRALTALGQPTDTWDTLIIYVVNTKLDGVTKREWEEHLNKTNTDFPTLSQLTDFLTKRCNFLETLDNKNKNEKGHFNKTLTHITTGKIVCAFCNKNHLNFHCNKIQNMPRNELYSQIKKYKLCINCLRPFHDHNNCNSAGCKHCGRKHNSLLHLFFNNNENTVGNFKNSGNNTSNANNEGHIDLKNTQGSQTLFLTDDNQENNNSSNLNNQNADNFSDNLINQHLTMHCLAENKQIILATAMIKILDSYGNLVEARAVLDSASQSNFITDSLVKRLGLKTQNIHIPVAGINNSSSQINKKTDMTIFSTNEKYRAKDTFLVVNKITDNLPQTSFSLTNVDIPCNIDFADPEFNLSRPVDVLLNVNIFFDILCVGQIKLGKNKPILHKTKLGWVFTGSLVFEKLSLNSRSNNTTLCNLSISNNDLQKQLEKFWVLENCNVNINEFLPQEVACEKHFLENFKRDSQGRFEVSLPLVDNKIDLGDSSNMAIKRFYSLEKRLQRDENLKSAYCNFMAEYERLGHMSRIESKDIESNNLTYYMPHHGVVKSDSTTTKLRVVFDASAKSDSGVSLNDVLMTGPVIQNELLSIILNFRIHTVVFTGDIEKMYRQVLVTYSDRQLQRIVWRSQPQDDLQHYTLNTVTYGTASASFLAIRCLNQVAYDNAKKYPEASNIILNCFYVDDLLTGSDSIEKAIVLKNQIIEILCDAGFPLRKFYSNKKEVLDDCDLGQLEQYDLSEDKTKKTLGLFWHPGNDTLNYSVNFDTHGTTTKREILSVIAKIFDPLGLAGPIIVQAKIIMQKLWQCKVGWDESVPVDIYTLWISFFKQLPALDKIKIPRQVVVPNYVSIELHGFSDASEVAYAACIYLVTTDNNGVRHSKLLCAKSRVAPLKTISLPRLELCGALLLACLTKKVEMSLSINIDTKYLWCDSTIVLSWIAAEPNNWNTFVANRITQIHELTEKWQWRHVDSRQNSADVLSRGATVLQLINCDLWWQGPIFLTQHESCWPAVYQINTENVPERKKSHQLSFFTKFIYQDQDIFKKYSNFTKLIRVFAYVMRFISNLRTPNKILSRLTQTELDNSLNILLKMVQFSEFSRELNDLRNEKQVSKDSKLYSLNPFIDTNGIIRLGGRIRHSDLTPDIKHPILLPPNHEFTILIIRYEHRRNLHAATQALLSIIRNKYWIIHGKNAIKRVINKCICCFKAKPSFSTPLMGDLPRARLLPSRPFLTVGCDFAGPIMIKDGKLKSRKIIKAYISIFICFVTRAIHIELVGDLTTDSFLNALKRFVARRGLCQDIYTDNAKNFTHANVELQKIFKFVQNTVQQHEVSSFMVENNIRWHFIPPRSPSFGGLWEASVKSMKYHLVRVLGEARLTFESLSTVLCQIEAILNSRPLTPISSDPNDFLALTPSHFLIGDLLNAVPQRDVYDVPDNRLILYERLQRMVQHFWRRWSNEYLTQLQPRGKWNRKTNQPIQIGSLTLLREENVPPQQWVIGRIVDVHPGKDNVIRVVSVKTKTGVFKRAVTKISVLPIEID